MKSPSEMSAYEIQLRNDIRKRKLKRIKEILVEIEELKVELADLERQDLTLIEEPTHES